ncbi:MAG: glycosyltransferase family 2 protein [Verrucomicrobiota bacterium]
MRFHCLLPVRDEADILAQTLNHALAWADSIWVYDTGSVDCSWEIVQEAAARDKRVIPVDKAPVFFSETHLRPYLFDLARRQMEEGDWFLRMDADEFHHVSPRDFVTQMMRPHETLAYHQYFDFRLLKSEAEAWGEGGETVADRSRPIEERRRNYTVSVYSEPRLCRYRTTMKWPAGISFPFNAGYVARERLPIRHYPHRDPLQLQRRCRLRALMMGDPTHDGQSYLHWLEDDWKSLLTPDDAPGLLHWPPGRELPQVRQLNHLRKGQVRLAQRLLHAGLLPLMDRRRPAFGAEDKPVPLPAELARNLETLLNPKN